MKYKRLSLLATHCMKCKGLAQCQIVVGLSSVWPELYLHVLKQNEIADFRLASKQPKKPYMFVCHLLHNVHN